jgi:hypothetical protein
MSRIPVRVTGTVLFAAIAASASGQPVETRRLPGQAAARRWAARDRAGVRSRRQFPDSALEN